jgi:RND family efflux transporter MFP subunit
VSKRGLDSARAVHVPVVLVVVASLSGPLSAWASSFECLIDPVQVVEIRSPVEGLIDKIYVQRGDDVRKGQTLVELDASVERSTLESAKYRAKMEGRIASAKNRLEYAIKKFERTRNLQSKNYLAAQTRDEAETEKRLAESELQDAVENQELANLEFRRASDLLNLRTLRSPFNGVVVDRMLNPGDLAESGTGRRPIMKVALIDPLKVEVILPLEAYGKIKTGMTAQVIPEGLGGRYPASVKIVDRVFDAASGTFGVRLELPNHKGALPGGIRCQVEFEALKGVEPRPIKRK